MNLWRLNSLQIFKPSIPSSQHPSSLKPLQTLSNFDGEITQAIINLIHKGNFTPTFHSYSKLLSQCIQTKSLSNGKQIHAHIIRTGYSQDYTLGNHLINLYFKCRVFGYARKVFDEFTEPDLVAWSSLISGYSQNGFSEKALWAFEEMYFSGIKCNHFTFPSVLKACSMVKDLNRGRQVHGMVLTTGFDPDVFVANALVVMYAKSGELGDSRRLFDEIPERNVVSWNTLFSSYVQNDCCGEAVGLFREMVVSGIKPNEFSLSSTLNACTGAKDYWLGRRVHGY